MPADETRNDGEAIADRLRNQQKALADFGLFAFRSTDLDEILHRATELVAEGLDVRMAKVLELLPGGDELLVRAGVNWKPGVVGNATLGAGADSPAGYALRRDEPVISHDVSKETRFKIPQMMIEHGIRSMVNVVIAGEDAPFGVLEVDAPQKRSFDEDDVAFLQTYANMLAAAVDRNRAHKSLESGVREQKMLVRELQHRVKNILGLVQSLANQTSAVDEGARTFRETFVGRLQALARAENLSFEDHAQEMDMAQLVDRSVEPFRRARDAFEVGGPSLRLPARCGRIMGLVVHELGTNATKHGALTAPGGQVRIAWRVDEAGNERRVDFSWTETGGPEVRRTGREGFGTRLLTALVSYEMDGEAALDHAQEGLRYRLQFAVPSR